MSVNETDALSGADAGSALSTETQTTESAPLKVSMEDTIRNAFREQQAKGALDEGAETGEGAETETQTQEPRTNKAGRLIDAQGRFIKKDGTVVATEAEADTAESAQASEQTATSKYGEPPKSWRKEAKTDWDKVPEGLREEIYRREEDMHRGLAQYKQFADVGTTLHKVIEPYAQMIVGAGMNAPALIGDLLNMQKVMTTGKPEERVAMALQILDNTGLSLEQLTQAAQSRPAQTQVDPSVAELRQELAQIKGRFTSMDQEREQAVQAETNAEIEKFRGDPAHEHFDAVALDMSALLANGRAQTLQEAYDKAIWAVPEIRAKLQQKHEQDIAKKQAEQASAARKASGANVIRRGTPPAPVKPGTMEDTIRQELRRLNGGG